MKNILTRTSILLSTLLIYLTLVHCSSVRQYDTSGFTSKGHTIYYQGREMATLTNIEYSLDGGKLVKEMSFKLKSQEDGDKVRNLIAFIHSQHKDWEIEIDYPITDLDIDLK